MADPLEAILANLESGLAAAEGAPGQSSPIEVEIINLSSTDETKQEAALREIINYTLEEENRQLVHKRDALTPIVKLLSTSEKPIIKILAAHALANLSLHAPSRQSMGHETGAVSALINALRSDENALQERALAALANITVAENELRAQLVEEGAVPVIKAILSSSDEDTLSAALMLVANSSVNGPVCVEFIKAGTVAPCGQILRSSSSAANRKYALWALAALSCQPSAHEKLVGFVGDIGNVIKGNCDAQDQVKALTALVNLSGHASAVKEIINADLISAITRRLASSDATVLAFALQIVQNLALTEEGRQAVASVDGDVATVQALQNADSQLALHALRAITNLSQDGSIRKRLQDKGAVSAVQRFKSSSDAALSTVASSALSNLTL